MEASVGKHVDLVHIISGDLWAGAEVQVFHTLSQLKRQGKFSCYAILFNDKLLNRKLKEIGIETIVLDESKHNNLTIIIALRALLCKLKPKIVHIHAYKEHLLGRIANSLEHNRAAMIRTFHGITDVPNELKGHKSLKRYIINKIETIFLNDDKLIIIAVSKDLEGYLQRSYPKATVVHIYNSLPFAERNFTPNRDHIRKKWDIPNDTFWIGTVARLEELKNLGMLVEVGKRLASLNMRFRISIWGEGRLKDRLQGQIAKNNLEEMIRLEGFEKDILPVLSSIDLFVLCSKHEGLPMSLLEAMSVETPVVCTKVGGIKEVVADDHSGLLVSSNDVAAMAQAIVKLQQDKSLRGKLIKNARAKVESEFDIEITNKRLIGLYDTILENRRSELLS